MSEHKNKVIFLDIDGVLNGYSFWSVLGWHIVLLFHSDKLRLKYREWTEPFEPHQSKVKRLAKIVHITGAKVVMSSSWRDYFWKVPYDNKTGRQKKLEDLFKKYNIEVIDITPHHKDTGHYRDLEIMSWLEDNKSKVDNFIILDDENTSLEKFQNDTRFIQTSSVPRGRRIMGMWYENTGIKNKHVRRAIQILGKE